MSLNPKASANSLAVVSGALYFICALWTLVSRSSYMGMMSTWVHGVNLSALPSTQPGLTSLLTGLLTFVLIAWLTGYAIAVAYNYFIKQK